MQPATGSDRMPSDLRAAYIAAVQREAPPEYQIVRGGALEAPNQAQRFLSEFTNTGVRVAPQQGAGAWSFQMSASRYGCSDVLTQLPVAEPDARQNRVEYRREGTASSDPVVEWYHNGPLGLEQGFTLASAPGCRQNGGGEVTIEIAVGGNLSAELVKEGTEVHLRDETGHVALRYTDLHVSDASGEVLPARLDTGPSAITIRVDDTAAAYPIVVDPLVWVEQSTLLASDGMMYDALGYSVAIDGTTALVGAIGGDGIGVNRGAAYVFEKVGGTWTQTAKLWGSDSTTQAQFGWSVGLRGDTALIGARYDRPLGISVGAAYIFVRSGGTWTQEMKFQPVNLSSAENFGYAVALPSADRAIVGAPDADANKGAVYVFTKSGGVWTQEARLSASDPGTYDRFGHDLAADGDTIAIAAPTAQDYGYIHGKAYIFDKVGGVWTETKKLLPADLTQTSHFGTGIAMSGDTVAVGASADQTLGYASGAVYVFDRNGGAWPQTGKLFPWDTAWVTNNYFGTAVSMLGDTLLVGAYNNSQQAAGAGAAYIFDKVGGAWTPRQKLLPSAGEANRMFGFSVAMSTNTMVIGAHGDGPSGHAPGRAHIFESQFAFADGDACAQSAECASGYCVDGVCCNSACGGNVAGDCQACSVAAGASESGVCSVFSAGTLCRAATDVCDVAETCSGVSTACPANGWASAGTVCNTSANSCDAAETCTGSSALCPRDLGPVFTCATPCAAPSFGAATTISTGAHSPQAVRLGDFDGDGDVDIVTANYSGNYLKIFLGNGSGNFTASSTITVTGVPREVVVADFNEDGKLDLATANYDGNNAAVLLGNGNGTFGAPTYHAANVNPADIVAADFDEDGHLDFITANRGDNNATVFFGTGTGSFPRSSTFATGGLPRSVVARDFNGDGRIDAATANTYSSNLTIFQGSGTGSLSSKQTIAVGANPRSVAVHDFNSDGRVDIATAIDKQDVVKVMLGNGDGTFGSSTSFATGTAPYFVTPGDYNGDGVTDFAIANEKSNDVSILLGNGDGTFGAATNFAVGTAPHSLRAADFDGDSDLDLVVANSSGKSISVLLNTCSCSLACVP
ncbi:FG-GAP-like repeat-containing protein [Sorangium sp. So ce448]|uniref:FG-GAP-like repeat-containing protein n=1 Tax=Sorangium sp. So ce448 TaxID=3133314 RepID=UPI003F6362AE